MTANQGVLIIFGTGIGGAVIMVAALQYSETLALLLTGAIVGAVLVIIYQAWKEGNWP